MARVTSSFYTQLPSMDHKDLKDPILFVVDMVNGFVKEGALHDIAILDICPTIIEMIEKLACKNVFICDSHPPKAKEFDSYPPHCVIGTSESEVVDELKPYIHEVFRKNSTNTFTCTDFQLFLKERLNMYKDIVICGCCSDICIMQFALCLQAYINEHNLDQRVIVVVDAIDTYHIDGIHDAISTNEFSILNMKGNGIEVINHFEGE